MLVIYGVKPGALLRVTDELPVLRPGIMGEACDGFSVLSTYKGEGVWNVVAVFVEKVS